jgi:hypothetical protein
VRDLVKRQTKKVDVDPRYPNSAYYPSVNASGRFIAYEINPIAVLVRDMKKGTTEVASVYNDGTRPEGLTADVDTYGYGYGGRWISDNGRYVAFSSHSGRFIPADNNGQCDLVRKTMPDVFVRDLKTDRTERVSVASTGEQADWGAGPGPPFRDDVVNCAYTAAGISGNGRFVSFSSSTNFYKDDSRTTLQLNSFGGESGYVGDVDSYLYDRKTGTLHWTSVGNNFAEADCKSMASALSRSGRYASFVSCARNLSREEEKFEWNVFVRDLGPDLGIGGLGDRPQRFEGPAKTCVPGTDACVPVCMPGVGCIPPSDALSVSDESEGGVDPAQGAGDLIGMRIAYRPTSDDLFVFQEIRDMPSVGLPRVTLSASAATLYGLRFEAKGRPYEVRATSLGGGTFGLFECRVGSGAGCSKVGDLEGGYGTTGDRIVFSLPLAAIGLERGGRLGHVESFSAVGTIETGAIEVLDTVTFE